MIDKNFTNKDLIEFSYVFGFGFPFLIGWLIPFIYGHSFKFWTLLIAIPILFFRFLDISKLRYFYLIWMRLGFVLGWINSRIILGLVFLIVLVPISFMMKIFGHDPIMLKKTKTNSYKITRKGNIDLNKIF